MKAKNLLAVAAFASFSLHLFATTHYVDAGGTSPVVPYTSWATAATNLQDAVFHAGIGDTILVTNGVYDSGGYYNSGSNRIYVINGLTLKSVNGPAFTVIQGYQVPGTTNGASAIRGVYLTAGTTLSGFTVTNGATISGGNGGGVCCDTTNCVITNCVITGNAAYSIGGGAFRGTLINCILSGNVANPSASVGDGGGAGYSVLINCILTRNTAGYLGGATAWCDLLNCTVVSNAAGAYVGAVQGGSAVNSIIYYNFTYYTNADAQGGADFTNCCVSFPTNGLFNSMNNFSNPPVFADAAFHLSPRSPCINTGTNLFVRDAEDLDANPRLFGGTVDLGAYEFQSTVRYVNVSNAVPVSPFTSWITAATNIQDAIDVSSTGDVVLVSNGIYNVGGRAVYGTATNRMTIDRAISVQSINGPAFTTIAGLPGTGGYFSLGYRCVYLTNGARLSGFTLTNGAARASGNITNEQSGAGIWCESTSAMISNCVITHCYVNQLGGGVYQGTLDNCLISNDTAFISGGGVYNSILNKCMLVTNKLIQGTGGGGAAYSVLTNCNLANNFAPGAGGGAYRSTLNSCVVSNNSASSFGGGVAFGIADNSLICSNRASVSGAGAYSNILNNCTVKNNFVSGSGGGGACLSTLNNCLVIFNGGAKLGGGALNSILINCTVVSNSIIGDGGGINGGSATNCIIYDNAAIGGSNFYGATLSFSDTFPFPTNGIGNITNEPAFVDLVNGDLHLQSNSPCINSGKNAYAVGVADFDGNARIAGGTVDMGAYEFQSPSSIISYAWEQQFGLPTDGSADNSDSDGDGMSNWKEWIAGTDPTNAASVLEMYSPPSTNNAAGITVSWQSVTNVSYYLDRSSDLSAGFLTVQSNIVGQAGTTTVADVTATNAIPYFYRVGIQ
ncbi:MAG TPA: thrombospondin type 3 repeat-containing protein [Verrucomicrobiae bacterium]|nr:thrombospondin type 3 repeat-containing protein [Verrucomicrobiae bacterium]